MNTGVLIAGKSSRPLFFAVTTSWIVPTARARGLNALCRRLGLEVAKAILALLQDHRHALPAQAPIAVRAISLESSKQSAEGSCQFPKKICEAYQKNLF
jgi:hypothetical protein